MKRAARALHRLAARARDRVAIVIVNQRDVGIARDEIVYMQAGARYADWWLGLVTFEHGIGGDVDHRRRSAGRTADRQQPRAPAADEDAVRAVASALLHDKLGVARRAHRVSRLPTAVLARRAGAARVRDGARAVGARRGDRSRRCCSLLLPRALFHAGLACFDAPIMTLWFATVYAYWRCLDGRKWPWQVGVVFGLALATKHTALLLPFALGVHYLVVAWRARGAGAR